MNAFLYNILDYCKHKELSQEDQGQGLNFSKAGVSSSLACQIGDVFILAKNFKRPIFLRPTYHSLSYVV